MSPAGTPRRALQRRLGLIGAAVILMLAAIALVRPARDTPGPGHAELLAPELPFPEEADVFRLTPADIAAGALETPRPGARRRTLALFQSLRAYPGAPPRIPHSLAPDEFRRTTCNACHERGGYSARFAAYAPITPHPGYRNCLQCHTADDGSVGIPAYGRGRAAAAPDARVQRPPAPLFVPLDWRPAQWPAINLRPLPGSPQAIPHTLELRGNCLACHVGPGAVAEIRTTHPERANCLQCHVPAARDVAEEVFSRQPAPAPAPAGGP
jgi:cytochrome c-type protein NapB